MHKSPFLYILQGNKSGVFSRKILTPDLELITLFCSILRFSKRSIDPALRNEIKGYAQSGTHHAMELNFFLEEMRYKVYEHQQNLTNRNKIVTVVSLKNAFLNIKDD